MCHQKSPTFFSLAFTERPHFYQLSPNDPLFLTNSLWPEDPDTSLSFKDPSFSHLIVKQVTSCGKKIWIFENIDKFDEMLRNFGPFWRWKPPFWMHFTERPPIFVGFVTERPPFWCNLSPKDPYIWGAWWHSYVIFICECPPGNPMTHGLFLICFQL